MVKTSLLIPSLDFSCSNLCVFPQAHRSADVLVGTGGLLLGPLKAVLKLNKLSLSSCSKCCSPWASCWALLQKLVYFMHVFLVFSWGGPKLGALFRIWSTEHWAEGIISSSIYWQGFYLTNKAWDAVGFSCQGMLLAHEPLAICQGLFHRAAS